MFIFFFCVCKVRFTFDLARALSEAILAKLYQKITPIKLY